VPGPRERRAQPAALALSRRTATGDHDRRAPFAASNLAHDQGWEFSPDGIAVGVIAGYHANILREPRGYSPPR
jgi:hypothetical protein